MSGCDVEDPPGRDPREILDGIGSLAWNATFPQTISHLSAVALNMQLVLVLERIRLIAEGEYWMLEEEDPRLYSNEG